MSESLIAVSGPAIRLGMHAGRAVATRERLPRATGRGKPRDITARRGRPSYGDYASQVRDALRYDLVQLDECAALAQLPGVQELSRRHTQRLLPVGSALRSLFDQAVADVMALAQIGRDPSLDRIAVFLRIWYGDRGTVADAAAVLELSRSRVYHAVKPLALELVTRRFLELASIARIPASITMSGN